jgi:peptidoglycan/xylan/chitin deacetylase (PgdA/CDA1 family)
MLGMLVRSTARRALGQGVKAAAAFVDVVRPPKPGVVVLIYHRVGGRTTSNVDLPTEVFDQQVGELAGAGRIVSIDDAAALLERGEDPGSGIADPVVLTFDDGTADWAEEALPVLARHGAPATFYVATEFVEQQRSFPGEAKPASWSALGELVSSGLATIGSHTHRHALLDRVDASVAADELDRSIDLIGERLGVPCNHFAYPKALLGSPAAEGEVRRRFRTAAIAGSETNRYHSTDVFRLARTPIQVTDGMKWFRRKAAGGLRAEDRARTVLNRGRYSGATT